MRNILLVLSVVMLLCTGCFGGAAYYKKEDAAELRKCESVGWGIIGTAAAVTSYKECVNYYDDLGYERITQEEYKTLKKK